MKTEADKGIFRVFKVQKQGALKDLQSIHTILPNLQPYGKTVSATVLHCVMGAFLSHPP